MSGHHPWPPPSKSMKLRPIDLHRAGARFIFIPVCANCKKQAPSCSCGKPTKRPA